MHFCGKEKSLQQLWRLRLNWAYLMVIASLYAISYTSISSSFHQFITNPTFQEYNYSWNTDPGLGQSEMFYSWVIALFNVGALVGAIGSGVLVKYIPYWHLILLTLIVHTVGYVLYAISYKGWVIMLSKFLSGIFIGGEMTLALSYFAETSAEYKSIWLQLGEKCDDSIIKRRLFAWHNIGVGIGYILGPGAAAVLAQFNIDQFRSIAWFNVAFGVAFIVLQVVIFKGESSFTKLKSQCANWKLRRFNFKAAPQEVAILTFLILCRGVLSFRFGVYETIYNPVLSDYFGFDVKYSSYFFFALVTSQISGTVLLLVLQQIRLSSRVIAIIGLLMSIAGCVLMADWQAIPFDNCTHFSPYHNPRLNYPNVELQLERLHNSSAMEEQHFLISTSSDEVNCRIISQNNRYCEGINNCYLVQYSTEIKTDSMYNYPCEAVNQQITKYLCEYSGNEAYCLYINDSSTRTEEKVHSQSYFVGTVQHVQHVTRDRMRQCMQATSGNSHCHWIPYSIVTKNYCNDCPQICRNPDKSLNFVQFCTGAALLMLSIPIAWVPVAAMASERTRKEMQGVMMGVVVALTAIGRIISPLWLDATYEGMSKRTFLAMAIMITVQLPFLMVFLLAYYRLQPPVIDNVIESDLEDSDSSDEHSN